MLSIILPTRNKPEFLNRAFSCYSEQKLKYKIYVADSSSSEYREEVRKVINKFSHTLELEYKEYQESDMPNDKIYFTLKNITTKYSVITADDDFHIPKTLDFCVDFLEKNPDYSAVHGDALFFKMKNQKVFGEIESIYDYSFGKLISFEQNTAQERVSSYLNNVPSTTWMSVQRTENLLLNYKVSSEKKLNIMTFAEGFPSLMSYIQGKTKLLEGKLFIFREAGAEKHYNKYVYSDWFSHITDEKWIKDYNSVTKVLIEQIADKDNISKEKAKEFFHKEYMFFFFKNLQENINKLYIPKSKEALKQKIINKLRNYSFIKKIWYRYNTKRSGVLDRYKEDFEPIRKVIEETKI